MKKVLVVSSNYYKEISDQLFFKVNKILKGKFKVKLLIVPGVFEIPFAISKHIKKYDASIAIGCVIKGQTPHFDFISKAVTQGIMKISIEHKKPVINAVLTCLNKKQAVVRLKKGSEAAKTLLSVIDI